MCGIAGIWTKAKVPVDSIQKMTSALSHRGPDDCDIWMSQDEKIALGHRRLSILDLSPMGRQPMHSACGRFVIVYNGEIYNHNQIRYEMERESGYIDWRGQSDTETLLRAIAKWGLERSLSVLDGMFAFALWDKRYLKLTLVRDRLGEKPLYYGHHQGLFIFGSELKVIKAAGFGSPKIDSMAVGSFLHKGYVSGENSIFGGVKKVPPGTFIEFLGPHEDEAHRKTYWSIAELISTSERFEVRSSNELVDRLDGLINESISNRLISDVPVGAFLSGGCDSSLVAAIMTKHANGPINTFSVGFREAAFNEAAHAKEIAKFLGSKHHAIELTPETAIANFERIGEIYDEPFADSSQLPMLAVSSLASKSVSVVLSGDGGDELFCGYERYWLTNRLWSLAKFLPPTVRVLATETALSIVAYFSAGLNEVRTTKLLKARDNLYRLLETLSTPDFATFYETLIYGRRNTAESLMVDPSALQMELNNEVCSQLNFLDRMMFVDQSGYLPDDILTKLDRATMAHGLEGRVPLLDHKIVEFAWALPTEMKVRDKQGKWILREVLNRYIPRSLFERPKKGFSVPVEEWLKGPLRQWAEDYLNSDIAKSNDFVRYPMVQKMWHEHITGKRRWHTKLWNLIVLYNWLDRIQR